MATARRPTKAVKHLQTMRYALALNVSLDEAARKIAVANHDRAMAALRAKGYRG